MQAGDGVTEIPGAARPPLTAPESCNPGCQYDPQGNLIHRPTCLATFTGQLRYAYDRWYVAKRKHAKTLVLSKEDAFVGGVLSGLDMAQALALESGDEDLAARIALLPGRK